MYYSAYAFVVTIFFSCSFSGWCECQDCQTTLPPSKILFQTLSQENQMLEKSFVSEIFEERKQSPMEENMVTNVADVSNPSFSNHSNGENYDFLNFNFSNFILFGNDYIDDENSEIYDKDKFYDKKTRKLLPPLHPKINGKLIKNKINSTEFSDMKIMRLNINSKKIYRKNSRHISTHDQMGKRLRNSGRRVKMITPSPTVITKKVGPLLTRQFLKNVPRHTTQFTSTQTPPSTMRVRSRMSRDNRRYFQDLERQFNLQDENSRSGSELYVYRIASTLSSFQKSTEPNTVTSKSNVQRKSLEAAMNPSFLPNFNQPHSNIYDSVGTTNIHLLKSPNFNRSTLSFTNQSVSPNGALHSSTSAKRRQSQHYPNLPIIQPLQQNNKPKHDRTSQLHQRGGKVQLSGSRQ